MRIAVIPARGGSKRISRKNIRLFAGRPMIDYAIAAARDSALFEHVIVSTDDNEIAAIAQALGAEVPFMRPAALADDQTPTVPVISHAIAQCDALGWRADSVCCLYPGVPLLQITDLQASAAELAADESRYVFPVAAYPSPIQRALLRAPDGATRPASPQYAGTRTQDLEPAYYDAGQFYWATRKTWLDGLNIHQNARTMVLPEWRVVDIDTEDDWLRAEIIYNSALARAQT